MFRYRSIALACAFALIAACSRAATDAQASQPPQSAGSTASTPDATAADASTPQPSIAAGPCQPLVDALVKLATTPNHQTYTGTDGGRPDSGEVVNTGDTMYLLVDGKWHKMPYDARQMVSDLHDKDASTMFTCKRIGGDSVDGQPATAYASHDRQDDGDTVDTQLWISDANGLPLKQTIDVDVGGGTDGKSHKDVRFDYGNVQPPAGVQ